MNRIRAYIRAASGSLRDELLSISSSVSPQTVDAISSSLVEVSSSYTAFSSSASNNTANNPAFMQIYACQATGSQTISANAPQKLTQLKSVGPYDGVNFLSNSVNVSTGDVTIPLSGTYRITIHASFDTNLANNEHWLIRGFRNSSPIPGACLRVTKGSGKTRYNFNINSLTPFDTSDVFYIQLSASLGSTRTFNVSNSALTIEKIK